MPAFNDESVFGAITGLVRDFGVPLAQSYLLGAQRTTGDGGNRTPTVNERIRYNNLNGSGPNDPSQAQKSSGTFMDFLFGQQTGNAVQAGATGMGAILPLLLIVLVLVLLFRKV